MDWNNIIIWSVFFGPLSIFECIQDLIFALYYLIFFYDVLTMSWIVFFLHHRMRLSQANKGVWSVFIKSQTLHTPNMLLKTYLFVNHFSFSKYWTQKFESSSEGLVNFLVINATNLLLSHNDASIIAFSSNSNFSAKAST